MPLKYLLKKQVFPTVESPINIKLSEPWPFTIPIFLSIDSETIFVGISFFVSFTAVFIFFNNSIRLCSINFSFLEVLGF